MPDISDVQVRLTALETATPPPKVTRLLSGSGNFQPDPAAKYARVRMVGAGGGGGGNNTSSGSAAGTAGGDTTFGTATAKGGGRGRAANPDQTAAGTGAPDYILVSVYRGQRGQSGGQQSNNAGTIGGTRPGGLGGSSMLGGGGAGNGGGSGVNADANSGGGGGGGSTNTVNNDWSGSGGNGGDGVEFVISNPAASYPYAVGVGGIGGTGTAHNGGNGGSGIIIIEELYA